VGGKRPVSVRESVWRMFLFADRQVLGLSAILMVDARTEERYRLSALLDGRIEKTVIGAADPAQNYATRVDCLQDLVP
jgi:hypothetical protein